MSGFADCFALGKENTNGLPGLLIFGWIYILENQTSSFYNLNFAGTIDFLFLLLLLEFRYIDCFFGQVIFAKGVERDGIVELFSEFQEPLHREALYSTETGCFNEWSHSKDIFILSLFYRYFLCSKHAIVRLMRITMKCS